MRDILANKESLYDLSKGADEIIQAVHVECEVGREGSPTTQGVVIGTALVDIEASMPVQLNKPLLNKAFKAALGKLGRVRVEKRLLDADAPPPPL